MLESARSRAGRNDAACDRGRRRVERTRDRGERCGCGQRRAAAAAPAALTSNAASMLVRQGSRWTIEIGGALKESLHSLLDVGSVGNWWHDKLVRADERADLAHALWIIIAVLVPALVVEWFAKRLLRRALTAVAARRADTSRRTAPESESAPESVTPDSATLDEDHAPPGAAARQTRPTSPTPRPRRRRPRPRAPPHHAAAPDAARASALRYVPCRCSCSSASRA